MASNKLIFAVIPIIAVGLGFSIYTEMQKESVPIGGECSSRDDCVDRNDCLLGDDGTGICTTTCSVVQGKDSCPSGLTCTQINLSVGRPAGDDVQVDGVGYCMPARGAP